MPMILLRTNMCCMYIYNEVAIDYNAAFVGACAGLTPTPPDTQIVYGDLNGDQKVTSTDYTMLKRYLMKSIDRFNTSEQAADLNRDGKINSTDLTILKRYLLYSIPSLPIKQPVVSKMNS